LTRTNQCDNTPITAQTTIQISGVDPATNRPCPPETVYEGRYAVYPNPAAAEMTVEESQQTSFQATLYDAQGQPRRQQNAPQGRLRLDTRSLPAGLYYLQLRRGNQVERRQIQITH
jgi:hypothetical protein